MFLDRGLRQLALGLVAAIAVGCGGDDGPSAGDAGTVGTATGGSMGTAGTGGDVGAVSAVQQLIAARCGWLFTCCDRGEIDLSVGPFTADAPDCVARVVASLNTGNQAPPIGAGPTDLLVLLAFSNAAGNIDFNDEALTACVEFLSATQCAVPPPDDDDMVANCTPDETVSGDPCAADELVVGKLALGDECSPTLGVECSEGLFCADLGTLGTCIEAVEPGDFCFIDEHCQGNMFCDLRTGTCQEGSELGGQCGFQNPSNPAPGTETIRCALGLTCDPIGRTCVGACMTGSPCETEADCPTGHTCDIGRCNIRQPSGSDCQFGTQCETGFCNAGTCADLGADGSACVPHAQCMSNFCNPFTNMCAPQVGDGQPCPTFSDQQCQNGVCDNTNPLMPVCVGFVGEGGMCLNDAECDPAQELVCAGGTCQQMPLGNGSPCTSDFQCQSALCWQLFCDDPAAPGEACSTVVDPMIKPCSDTGFCDAPEGMTTGTCQALVRSGGSCGGSDECWGTCEVNWGALVCDATPARGEAFCDGP